MYQSNRGSWVLSAAVAAVLGGAPGAGHAQARQGALEEIIVTAERREMSLQETPISVAAFSSETMAEKNIDNIQEVAEFTPNLDIKGGRFTGDSSPVYMIRGLTGGTGGTGGERAVGMYIDGVFVPRTAGPYMSVMDLERIEILRGPQGTLFGRNSTGGAIRVFTKQPGPETEGFVRLTAGDYNHFDATGMLNVPFSDSVFFRIQGGQLSQDGYVRRGTQLLGATDDTVGRAQLAIKPSDAFSITFGVSASESDSNGSPQDVETFDMLPTLNYQGNRADWISDFLQNAGQARLAVDADPRIIRDDFTAPDWCFVDDADPDWDAACELGNRSEYQQFDVNLRWQINDTWNFSSVTGLSHYEFAGVSDSVGINSQSNKAFSDTDSFYQEIQFTAAFDRFDLVAGVSYFIDDVTGAPQASGPTYERQGTSSFATQAANGNGVFAGRGPNGVFLSNTHTVDQRANATGVFANVTWHITDRLNLTPGVRYSMEDKEVDHTRTVADDFVTGDLQPRTIYAEESWEDTDWRLTADYRITDNHMVYVTGSRAFRAGSYNYNVVATATSAAQTAAIAAGTSPAFTLPDEVTNYEAGFRTEWFDRRLRLNMTYFDMVSSDRVGPVQVPDLTTATGFRIEQRNTGDVDINGYEIEGQIAATDNLFFDFSAGLLDMEVQDPCANNGEFLTPSSAENSYALGGRWNVPMRSGGRFTFALNYSYTGPQETHQGGTTLVCFNPDGTRNTTANALQDSRYRLPGYGLLNGRVRYLSDSGRWEVSAYGNNLLDKTYAAFAGRVGGAFWDNPQGAFSPGAQGPLAAPERSSVVATRGRPIDYGLTFQWNFGGAGGARQQ